MKLVGYIIPTASGTFGSAVACNGQKLDDFEVNIIVLYRLHCSFASFRCVARGMRPPKRAMQFPYPTKPSQNPIAIYHNPVYPVSPPGCRNLNGILWNFIFTVQSNVPQHERRRMAHDPKQKDVDHFFRGHWYRKFIDVELLCCRDFSVQIKLAFWTCSCDLNLSMYAGMQRLNVNAHLSVHWTGCVIKSKSKNYKKMFLFASWCLFEFIWLGLNCMNACRKTRLQSVIRRPRKR